MFRLLRHSSTLVDPGYFTGNAQYYQFLMSINEQLRQHKTGPGGANGPWMSQNQMAAMLNLRLNKTKYDDLVQRLNGLYPVQEESVKQLLRQFVSVGFSLDKEPPKQLQVDELGRTLTYGSRKTAKVNAYLVRGQGLVYINGTNMSEYFPELSHRQSIIEPFLKTDTLCKYNVWAFAQGSGRPSQANALSVAVARGIAVHEPDTKQKLQDLGLLTIDVRQVERKKTNQPKARKKIQWVKR
ncbi:ribosomal protein S9/S16-domain-containing protein [Gorgonomyces haynaldii]|nr:ribosomal protein S9/S16-domain-containing protein [Gorgonomyces haynaldii]